MGPILREPANRSSWDCTDHDILSRSDWRVLLIEDGPDPQRRLLHLLERAGADVTLECNVQAGFSRVTAASVPSQRFDLILINLQSPFPDGIELADRLRRDGCPIPLVMISDHTDSLLPKQAYTAGCDLFLPSASADEELIARLQWVVGRRAAT